MVVKGVLAFVMLLVVVQFYLLALALVGLLPARRWPKGPGRRFLCFIPAHNEAAVIRRSVESLLNQDYRGAWRVVVLADRCTDDTARIARDLGAEVWERKDGPPGKQHLVAWAYNLAACEEWDALVFVDADNACSPNMLEAMDGALVGRDAVQVYLDTLNTWDSAVSRGYAASYIQGNVFGQRARARLGLSALLGGTGFAIRRDALTFTGLPTITATEDLELSILLVLAGRRVAYVEEARVWDEKPRTWWASIRQRARWMRGHHQNLLLYFSPLALRALRGDLAAVDLLAVLFLPATLIFSLVSLLLSGGWVNWLAWILTAGAVAAAATGRQFRDYALGAWMPAFAWTWLPAFAWGMATLNFKGWEKTTHHA